MGLEESPHCPFDVIEACRTGVRRDYHQPEEKLEARPIEDEITEAGDGSAAEEMDRDESAPTPDGWWKMTRDQKRRCRQNQKKRQGKVV